MVAGSVPSMDLGLRDSRVAIAGASRGLGFGCAKAFVGEGARVALGGRNSATLASAVDSLGGSAVAVVSDLSEQGGCERFVHGAVAALGGLDILVVNGGGPAAGTVSSHPAAAFEAAFADLTGVAIRLTEAALPYLRASEREASILAITSRAAKEPIDGLALSSVARTGLTAYLRMLATELAPEQIRVNAVAPGYHDTERLRELGADPDAVRKQIPLGRLGDAEDLGGVVAFLAGRYAASITGQTIVVDGGSLRSLF